METPSPAAPNPVRTHQWVALDLLVLIHPSIAAGEHPIAGIELPVSFLLTLLSAPDLYTASAWFRVAFPLEYSPKVYQSTESKRQETIY